MARIVYNSDDTNGSDELQEILDAKFTILVENEVVCNAGDLISAVALLMLVHYNFNLAYHKKHMNTLTFIQKVLMNIDTVSAAPSKVVRCLYHLNTFINDKVNSASANAED